MQIISGTYFGTWSWGDFELQGGQDNGQVWVKGVINGAISQLQVINLGNVTCITEIREAAGAVVYSDVANYTLATNQALTLIKTTPQINVAPGTYTLHTDIYVALSGELDCQIVSNGVLVEATAQDWFLQELIFRLVKQAELTWSEADNNLRILDGRAAQNKEAIAQVPAGPRGYSNFELWQMIPENSNKTILDYMDSQKGIKGEDGAQGLDGEMGVDGLSAFEIWQQQPGNEIKTLQEYWTFLATIGGFNFNVVFYNVTTAFFSIPRAAHITALTKSATISTLQYSLNGTTFTTVSGAVNIALATNAILYLKITFSGANISGTTTISGTYD